MELRPFGATDLLVSPVGLGAGHIGRADDADEATSLLHFALDHGVNFIDTARGYGESEARVGHALSSRRSEFVLSTKVGYDVPGTEDWTYHAVARGVDRALTTLRTDVIDVVFLHSCPQEVLERGDVIKALLEAKVAGKIRVAGYSGENEALRWAFDSGHFGALQTSVNLVDQRSSITVLPEAADRGVGVVAKRPLANAAWRHVERPVGLYSEIYWERLQTLGLTPANSDWQQTALRFAAYTPGVSTAIVGTKSAEHLQAAIAAAELGALPEAERATWVDGYLAHLDWRGEI
jgi:aryl-alcohol dehydrogenase-like predicted oxidoreductase